MMRASCAIVCLALTAAGSAAARDVDKQHYAGQETRAVTALSGEDIAQIEAGAGWGLAKAAELNGYPGPAHVLELAEKLDLTPAQRQRVEEIFGKMRAAAIETGKRYILAEAGVDEVFRASDATAETVADAVAEAARWRGRLRLVHLKPHLETAKLMSPEQRRRYDHLRGYSGGGANMNHDHHNHGGHRMPKGHAH